MNANSITKDYAVLTPEERFRLILAASGRGDDAERERLVRSGGTITLRMGDHTPYARAFEQLALLTFMELADDAARYLDAVDGLRDCPMGPDSDGADADGADETAVMANDQAGAHAQPGPDGCVDLALAAGFVLRVKADGWILFCKRLDVPPLLVWTQLPGFDRLTRALALTETIAFTPDGVEAWLNERRPTAESPPAEARLAAERLADEAERAFRQIVLWWSGRAP